MQGVRRASPGCDGHSARFHALWLRDNALDPKTRSSGNGQRLITVLDISPLTTIGSVAVAPNGDLSITFAPEGHVTVFPAQWLRERIYDKAAAKGCGWVPPEVELWDGALQKRVPTGSYAQLRTDRRALGEWLAAVRRYGFAMLTEVPRKSGSLCEVTDLFGYVRETNYGRWFEVRAEVNPTNLAYTNLGLQAHTDNPYRDPVPTLQLLSCLENTVEGGDSIVVDGVHGGHAATPGKRQGLRSSQPLPGALRICWLVAGAPARQAALHRAWSGWRDDRHPLQQSFGGAFCRRAL